MFSVCKRSSRGVKIFMRDFPYWLASQLPWYKEQQNTVADEQRKIREKADRYDKLVSELGFSEFLKIMVDKINYEIAEARKKPLKPEEQRVHVIRWDAMQELLDAAQNDISDTRKERDRLKEEEFEYLRLRGIQEREM